MKYLHIIALLCATANCFASQSEFIDLTGHQAYGTLYGPQDSIGELVLEEGGYSLSLHGNRWRAVKVDYEFTENTVIEFDFLSVGQAQIQAVGFDENLSQHPTEVFQLYGRDTWGNGDFRNYTSGIMHYRIPVGQYMIGHKQYLTLVHDDDDYNSESEYSVAYSKFSNFRIYEALPDVLYESIDLSNHQAYGAYYSQDKLGNLSLNNPHSLSLTGNRWRSIPINYTVTQNTVMEFDFISNTQGEIHGIGLDEDLIENNANRVFQLHGRDIWNGGIEESSGTGYHGFIKHYRIPVGKHMVGQKNYLVLVNDDDSIKTENDLNYAGNSIFSNIRLYESVPECTGDLVELQLITPNSEFIVRCDYDLLNSDIALPFGVKLYYDPSGSIRNGTLIMSGGKIDGNLLNASLQIEGIETGVTSTSAEFDFVPERWDIVEGRVDDVTAIKNRKSINKAIDLVRALQPKTEVVTFKIDVLDAYFDVDGFMKEQIGSTYNVQEGSPTRKYGFYHLESQNKLERQGKGRGIALPSYFTLQMTNNTHLRVQPHKYDFSHLLHVYDDANIAILGGNLYGDRAEHDFDSEPLANGNRRANEWNNLINLVSARHVLIEGVAMRYATGDGLSISSRGQYFERESVSIIAEEDRETVDFIRYNQVRPRSRAIEVRHCLFDASGRNNISVTDGVDVLIEKNKLLNAGVINETFTTKTSIGPYAGIDVEGMRYRFNGSANLSLSEKPEQVVIRDNIEKGSVGAAITVHIGYNVMVEDNQVDSVIEIAYGQDNTLRNNTVVYDSVNANSQGERGISVGKLNASQGDLYSNENNRVYGNTIIGFPQGIQIYGINNHVYDNTIIDFTQSGITLKATDNVDLYNNVVTSGNPGTIGIDMNATSVNNTKIYNNTISVNSRGIKISQVNVNDTEAGFSYDIYGNDIMVPHNRVGMSAYSAATKPALKGLRFYNNRLGIDETGTNAAFMNLTNVGDAFIDGNIGNWIIRD